MDQRLAVDNNGRIIPPAEIKSMVIFPDVNTKLIQPKTSYVEKLNRLAWFFPDLMFMSADRFEKTILALFGQLRRDPVFSKLPNGVCYNICLPWFKVGDYGKDFENIFLKAAADSYKIQFPAREFHNNCADELKRSIEIIDESHKRLIARMAEGSVAGILFFPFLGFSIDAVREVMPLIPGPFCLSGPIDLSVALITYLDELTRNSNTPGFDCAAVNWLKNTESSFYFKAGAKHLSLNGDQSLGNADPIDNCSSGLIFIGE